MIKEDDIFLHHDVGDLNISDGLKSDILSWDHEYQSTPDQNDPGRSGFETLETAQAHIEKGAELASRLQEEMGEGFSVEYRPISIEGSQRIR